MRKACTLGRNYTRVSRVVVQQKFVGNPWYDQEIKNVSHEIFNTVQCERLLEE